MSSYSVVSTGSNLFNVSRLYSSRTVVALTLARRRFPLYTSEVAPTVERIPSNSDYTNNCISVPISVLVLSHSHHDLHRLRVPAELEDSRSAPYDPGDVS